MNIFNLSAFVMKLFFPSTIYLKIKVNANVYGAIGTNKTKHRTLLNIHLLLIALTVQS